MRLLPLLLLAASLAFPQGSAAVDLKSARHKEQVQGDLKGAIDAYRKIIAKHAKDRATVAQAMLHLAQCHEKLGQSEARKVYEDLTRNFADQSAVAAQARGRLAALAGAPAKSVTARQIDVAPKDLACMPWNVSQDGRLFGAVDYLNGNIAVIDTGTGLCRPLTNYGKWNVKNGFVDQGAVSRDGKWMASWHYGATNDGEVRIVATDGTGERTIYVRRGREWGIPSDWSPDGKFVLVQIERSHPGSVQTGTADILLVPADGSAPKVLTSFDYAARHRPKFLFSPDGRFVAFDLPVQPGSADTDLVVMPAAGGPRVPVATHPAPDTLAGWTAAGHLVFTSTRDGRNALYQVALANGRQTADPVQLRPLPPTAAAVGVSASGALFYAETLQRADAMTAQIDLATGQLTSEPRRLFPNLPHATSFATWSPDGRYVAARRWTDDPTRTTFVIQSVDGRESRDLTVPIVMQLRARLLWSPDGRYLHTSGRDAKGPGIFRIDVRTGAVTTLTNDRNQTEFTADGRYLFSRTGPRGGQIVRTDTQTGEVRTIYQQEQVTRTYIASPDGRSLAFVATGAQQVPSPMLILDIATGATREIDRHQFPHESQHFAWSPDSKYILGRRGASFVVIPAAGGEPKLSTHRLPEKANQTGFLFHPDGRTFTWSETSSENLYWALENAIPAR